MVPFVSASPKFDQISPKSGREKVHFKGIYRFTGFWDFWAKIEENRGRLTDFAVFDISATNVTVEGLADFVEDTRVTMLSVQRALCYLRDEVRAEHKLHLQLQASLEETLASLRHRLERLELSSSSGSSSQADAAVPVVASELDTLD